MRLRRSSFFSGAMLWLPLAAALVGLYVATAGQQNDRFVTALQDAERPVADHYIAVVDYPMRSTPKADRPNYIRPVVTSRVMVAVAD